MNRLLLIAVASSLAACGPSLDKTSTQSPSARTVSSQNPNSAGMTVRFEASEPITTTNGGQVRTLSEGGTVLVSGGFSDAKQFWCAFGQFTQGREDFVADQTYKLLGTLNAIKTGETLVAGPVSIIDKAEQPSLFDFVNWKNVQGSISIPGAPSSRTPAAALADCAV